MYQALGVLKTDPVWVPNAIACSESTNNAEFSSPKAP